MVQVEGARSWNLQPLAVNARSEPLAKGARGKPRMDTDEHG